jgi:hypothetical protein
MKSESIYPSQRSYLLKLHSEAMPDALAGRLQNLVTGGQRDFSSGHELLKSIAVDLAAASHEAPADATQRPTR